MCLAVPGKVVEIANSDDLYRHPREPYTQRLIASILDCEKPVIGAMARTFLRQLLG